MRKSNNVRRKSAPRAAVEGGTRQRLIRAASEVLERGGYGAASVVAIAERAGVSAGALYRHFPSKAELFVEVLRNAGEGELAEMNAAAEREKSFVARLEAVVATYARRALRNRRLAWALVHEPVDALVDAERLVHRRNYCRGMAALLRQGIAAGELPKQDSDLSAAALVGAISETLVGPLSPVGGTSASDTEIIAALLRFCRRSLAVGETARRTKIRSVSAARGSGGAGRGSAASRRRPAGGLLD